MIKSYFGLRCSHAPGLARRASSEPGFFGKKIVLSPNRGGFAGFFGKTHARCWASRASTTRQSRARVRASGETKNMKRVSRASGAPRDAGASGAPRDAGATYEGRARRQGGSHAICALVAIVACALALGAERANAATDGVFTSKSDLTSALNACSGTDYIACTHGATNVSIADWDVSAVTDMGELFTGKSSFNANISAWNTAKVTTMASMFTDAAAFNQNISAWNTTKVTTMGSMFAYASAFNQIISAWNTASATNMASIDRKSVV